MSVLNSTRWVALSQGTRILSQVIGMVVLARLVPPKEYGIMAMAAVVTNFAMIFRDLGSSAAIIQRKDLTNSLKSAVFWFNLGIGTFIALIIVIFSPLIVILFHTEKLQTVLIFLAVAFPLSSSGAVHQALLERDSNFRIVARIEVVSILIGLVVSIVLASLGAGVYSLVAQTLITMGLSSLQLSVVSGWKPSGIKDFNWPDLRSIFGFSSNLVGFNVVNYFSRNSDNIIIGHYFSSAILGAYSLAYRVMLFPLQSLTFVISRSLYPHLAKQQDDDLGMRSTYLNVVAVVATLVAPMMAGLVILRNEFINLFLGKGWDISASLLLWLAPTGFIQSILSTTGVVFMAKGATRKLMWLGLLGAILQVSAFLLGINGGVTTMVKYYLISNVINAVPVLILCMNLMGGSIFNIIKIIWVPITCAVSMMLVLPWVMSLLRISGDWEYLVFGALFGVVIYIVLYLAIGRNQALRLVSLARTR